jgi:hypothetical protein
VRVVLYLLLGWFGISALAIPLFGYLSYIAALMFPVLFVLDFVWAVRALTGRGRWAWAYLMGNLGVLAATSAIYAASLVMYFAGRHLATELTRPLYLAIVVLGCMVGAVAASRLRLPAP